MAYLMPRLYSLLDDNSVAGQCRPAAALDLAPASRIREAGLIALNPEGRAQNKKVRPTVRCPAVLSKALDAWEAAGLDAYDGRYVGYASRYSVRQALERVCAEPEVNLPAISPYSFRHKVTTVLRSAGVPEDQISRQLGHSGTGSRTTARYGEWSPDYLKAASAALDTWIRRVQKAAKKPRVFSGFSQLDQWGEAR
jgi:integrase